MGELFPVGGGVQLPKARLSIPVHTVFTVVAMCPDRNTAGLGAYPAAGYAPSICVYTASGAKWGVFRHLSRYGAVAHFIGYVDLLERACEGLW